MHYLSNALWYSVVILDKQEYDHGVKIYFTHDIHSHRVCKISDKQEKWFVLFIKYYCDKL